jgi:cell division septum initiation protein DivIVA
MDRAPRPTGSDVAERDELRRRIETLEADLSRYRGKEQLLVSTLVSANGHATAIREGARRDAELLLRKARAEAQKRSAAAERARDDAERELLRLRRITEEMRSGLSGFLTAQLEELEFEAEHESPTAYPNAELETTLDSAVGAQLKRLPTSDSDPGAQTLGENERRSTGGSAHGLRFR